MLTDTLDVVLGALFERHPAMLCVSICFVVGTSFGLLNVIVGISVGKKKPEPEPKCEYKKICLGVLLPAAAPYRGGARSILAAVQRAPRR